MMWFSAEKAFAGPNVAVTVCAVVKTKVQLVVPVQPDQPVKLLLAPGVSVSVTEVPGARLVVRTVGQLTPPTLLTTVPVPVPARATVKATGGATVVLKIAVTPVAVATVTLQVAAVPV